MNTNKNLTKAEAAKRVITIDLLFLLKRRVKNYYKAQLELRYQFFLWY
jgi:hypothetical protein